MTTILDAALTCVGAGISIAPTLPGGQKKPALPWKPYTQKIATTAEVEAWYTAHPEWGIAAISGKVSGNLLMIELEGRAAHHFATLTAQAETHGLTDLWGRVGTGWFESSPSGGLHWFLQCTEAVPGNQKLATSPDRLVLAETRGEGGYTIVAPTDGSHHASGLPWVRLAGGPATPATVTPAELKALLALFRSLDETPEPAPPTPLPAPTPRPLPLSDGRRRPGDQWAAETPWEAILEPQGWRKHHQDGQTTYWTRPGKKASEGASATTREDGNLYVFSTSTDFDTEIPLSKLFVHAHYHHRGNMNEAAKALAAQGFGDRLSDLVIDLPATPTRRPHLHVVEGSSALDTAPGEQQPLIQVQHSGDLTEAAAGKYLADAYHQHARYITESDRWLAWNGAAWEQCGKKAAPIKQLAIHAIEKLPIQTKEEARYRTRLLNSAGVNAALTLMATDPRVTVSQKHLDAHHGELNTPGGIVNLHTGTLTPSNPDRLHTRTTLLTPESIPTPQWDRFLDETFRGHPGIVTYVQQLAGYAATGYVRSQILPFLHGPGANGKSVLAEVLQRLLHDYAEPAPANFLMQASQQHPTEIARLHGARLVIASEVPEGARFDEVKVKQLTGGDTLTARYMHGDFFTFQPTHKLWLLGNHQPKVSAGGYSFWRRLRQIPFTNIVPEHRRDPDLTEKLVEEEGVGILAWIIRGAVSYLTGGLIEPDEVTQATRAYEESEDHLARFVDDRLHVGGGNMIRTARKDMRFAYVEWCKQEGQAPMTATAFTRELSTRFGIGTARSHGAHLYTNCTLLADPDAPEESMESPWADLGGGR